MNDPEPPAASVSPAEPSRALSRKEAVRAGVILLLAAAFFAFLIAPYYRKASLPSKRGGSAMLPEFTLPLISGGSTGARLSSAGLRGGPVVIDFWASFCQPCAAQAERLARVHKQVAPGVRIVGVATSEPAADSLRFLEAHPAPYENVLDEGSELTASLGITDLPTLLVVRSDGTIFAQESRLLEEKEILGLIAAAAESSSH